MEDWTEIRRRVLVEGVSRRQILRETGMHWLTLKKILEHSEPPGYRQQEPRQRKKLGPYLERLKQILKEVLAMPRRDGIGRGHLPRYEKPGGADHQRWGASIWGGERQRRGDGPRQGDRKGNPRCAQEKVPRTRLDQLMVKFVFEPRRPQIPKLHGKDKTLT